MSSPSMKVAPLMWSVIILNDFIFSFEGFLHETIEEVLEQLQKEEIKGEFVVIVK